MAAFLSSDTPTRARVLAGFWLLFAATWLYRAFDAHARHQRAWLLFSILAIGVLVAAAGHAAAIPGARRREDARHLQRDERAEPASAETS